jgi:hypothetical protein
MVSWAGNQSAARWKEGYFAMSMNAVFVQVEDAEIARFEADPDSVEALFANQMLPLGGC